VPSNYNNLAKEKLEQLIREYIEEYCTIERGLSKKTVKNKRHTLARVREFLRDEELSLGSVRKYTKYLYKNGWVNSSIGSDLKVIKAFVNYLLERKYIKESFSPSIRLPKIRRGQLNIVSAEKAEKIVIEGTKPCKYDHHLHKKAKREHREALRFILRTGLRLSEALRLKPEDINYENKTYVIQSKGGNIDVLPLPHDMIEELKTRKGKMVFNVTPNTLNICLKRGCKRLRIHSKLTVHTLRHIFCTELLKNGVPLQVVSRLMRHSSVKITDSVYSHYMIEDLSFALNKHPLITKGLSVKQVFDDIENIPEKLGIVKDKRFVFKIKRKKEGIFLNITCKN